MNKFQNREHLDWCHLLFWMFCCALSNDLFAQVPQTIASLNQGGESSRLSDDRRLVAFSSSDNSLVPGDSNGFSDVFIKDLVTNQIRRISENANGTPFNQESRLVGFSRNGQVVFFTTTATNIGLTQGGIFAKDLVTGITKQVLPPDSNGQSTFWDLGEHQSGRFVAFSSSSTNLVSGDTNGREDCFLRDLELATTRRVSVGSNGIQALGGNSTGCAISPDGSSLS